MSEFYDSIDRAFRDELNFCVKESRGEFCDPVIMGLPDGSYKLQLGMHKQPVPPLTTVRLLRACDVQAGVSVMGIKAYAESIVENMMSDLRREYNRRIDIYRHYIREDLTVCELLKKEMYIPSATDDYIDKVIFNPPATIVFFKDGQKVVVKCQEDDDWDEEKALAMAIVKHDHGLSVFNKILEKAERRYSYDEVDMSSITEEINNAAQTILRMFGKGDIEHACKNCKFNKMMWSAKYEKDMPFCASENSMINHYKSTSGEYENFYCKDFESKE